MSVSDETRKNKFLNTQEHHFRVIYNQPASNKTRVETTEFILVIS